MTARRWWRVDAPPTVANVGPGFDVLGLALPVPGDTAWAARREEPGVGFALAGMPGAIPVPADPLRNSAAVAASQVLAASGAPGGLDVVLDKRLPTGSGLGSSGASSAAGAAAAAAALEGLSPPASALLAAAMEGERTACGSPHADNVAPALVGGVVLVIPGDPPELVPLPLPASLAVVAVRPALTLDTAAARAAMPAAIPLAALATQSASLAALVSALYEADLPRLGRALRDVVAEPARAPLIRGLQQVLAAARDAGALGAGISGSGPSAFALTPEPFAPQVADAMLEAWEALGVAAEVVHAGPATGAAGALTSARLSPPPPPTVS